MFWNRKKVKSESLPLNGILVQQYFHDDIVDISVQWDVTTVEHKTLESFFKYLLFLPKEFAEQCLLKMTEDVKLANDVDLINLFTQEYLVFKKNLIEKAGGEKKKKSAGKEVCVKPSDVLTRLTGSAQE